MAFKIYQPGKIIEDLELCNPAGEVKAVMHVNIVAESIHKAFRDAWKNCNNARLTAEAASQDDAAGQDAANEQYGAAIMALFTVIFGAENTEKLLDFYAGEYTTMLIYVLPFIIGVVVPAINRVTEQKNEQLKSLYKGKRRGK